MSVFCGASSAAPSFVVADQDDLFNLDGKHDR